MAQPVTVMVGESADLLSAKNRQLLQGNMSEGESVEFFLVGTGDQALVALGDRLLVLKSGFLAGATFGGRAASFYYRDITSIEINTGMLGGVIEVCTASHQGSTQKDFWSADKNSDPFKVSNCLPIVKPQLPLFEPYLQRLREKIARAKQPSSTADSPSGLTAEIEKLANLNAAGVLSDIEFAQAKKKLLGL